MSHSHHHHHPHHEPKAFFVERASALSPGEALDVGCGPGAEALWLASRGWTVTGIDVSTAALDRARARDAEHRVTWHEADFTTWPLPANGFDLVSAHFVHVDPAARAAFFEKLARAVRPGGHLSFASHHPSERATSAGRPTGADLYFTPGEVEGYLERGRWTVIANETRPRGSDVDTVLFLKKI